MSKSWIYSVNPNSIPFLNSFMPEPKPFINSGSFFTPNSKRQTKAMIITSGIPIKRNVIDKSIIDSKKSH